MFQLYLCNLHEESLINLFFECIFAKNLGAWLNYFFS